MVVSLLFPLDTTLKGTSETKILCSTMLDEALYICSEAKAKKHGLICLGEVEQHLSHGSSPKTPIGQCSRWCYWPVYIGVIEATSINLYSHVGRTNTNGFWALLIRYEPCTRHDINAPCVKLAPERVQNGPGHAFELISRNLAEKGWSLLCLPLDVLAYERGTADPHRRSARHALEDAHQGTGHSGIGPGSFAAWSAVPNIGQRGESGEGLSREM